MSTSSTSIPLKPLSERVTGGSTPEGQRELSAKNEHAGFIRFLKVLLVLIVGLMALGAGVRAMNAGLSCPDWPLCFGQVIPDFHVGVWFEFVHRAYAGIVALLFAASLIHVFRNRSRMPSSVKRAAVFGSAVLTAQIVMGGLTVLLLVKAVIVTGHLLLATLFLCSVLWMILSLSSDADSTNSLKRNLGVEDAPKTKLGSADRSVSGGSVFQALVKALPILVFGQIALGGLVASTYSGSVCVDWPLCNGQWVPTWKGAIGLQVIHRFYAYALVILISALASWAIIGRRNLDGRIVNLLAWCGATVTAQTIVGILNLIWFIPAWLTVFHQTMALVLLSLVLMAVHRLRALPNI